MFFLVYFMVVIDLAIIIKDNRDILLFLDSGMDIEDMEIWKTTVTTPLLLVFLRIKKWVLCLTGLRSCSFYLCAFNFLVIKNI